jgi:hypothetical protein
MSDTLTKRDVQHSARLFAQEAGITEGYGSRGRVSANVVFQYLAAQPAKDVREIAGALGVPVPAKGKISEEEYVELTDFITKNAPK